jgi:hypothetical protein
MDTYGRATRSADFWRLRLRKISRGQYASDDGQTGPIIIVKLVDHDGNPGKGTPAPFDQVTSGGRLAPSLDPVVHQQDSIVRSHRSLLNLQDVAPAQIVGRSLDLSFGARKQVALLADRDEPDPERTRGGASKNETASFDPAHLGDVARAPRLDERRDNFAEYRAIVEHSPHIRMSAFPNEATEERVLGRPHPRIIHRAQLPRSGTLIRVVSFDVSDTSRLSASAETADPWPLTEIAKLLD